MTGRITTGLCHCGDEATHFVTNDDQHLKKVVLVTYFCEDHARAMLRDVGFALYSLLEIPDHLRREWRRQRKERVSNGGGQKGV